MMNVVDIVAGVEAINPLTEDEKKRCLSLAKMCLAPYENNEISNSDEAVLTNYLVAKVYLQFCVTKNDDNISSFEAGDVKISHSKSNEVNNAKMLFDMALKDAAGIVCDNEFAFMEV